jgi:hypothetical protein
MDRDAPSGLAMTGGSPRPPRDDGHGGGAVPTATSTVIVFPLVSNRQDGYVGLVVDFEQGYVA